MIANVKAGDPCPVCKMPAPADGIRGHGPRCYMLDREAEERHVEAERAAGRRRFVGVDRPKVLPGAKPYRTPSGWFICSDLGPVPHGVPIAVRVDV